jgi:hypothetical protein
LGKKIFTTEAQSSRRFLSQVAFPLLKQGIKRLILGSDSAVTSKKED